MGHMTAVDLGMLLAAVATAATGQVLLRLGMRTAGAQQGSLLVRAATNPAVLGGLVVFCVSAVLWLWVLSKVPLSVAYPFNGLGFLVILLASHVFLGERLRSWSVVGATLVAVGVSCLALAT